MLLWIIISFAIILLVVSIIQRIRIIKLVNKPVLNTILPENITEALIITDKKYNITYWNKKAEQMLGYAEYEAKGKRLGLLLKSKSEDSSLENIRKIIDEKKSWNGNITYTHKNGTPVFANVTTSVTTDKDGNLNSTISIIRDFSSLKHMISSLENDNMQLSNTVTTQRHEMEMVFNRITNGFFALDYDFCIRYINPVAAETHQLDMYDSIGKNFLTLTKNELENTEFTSRIIEAAQTKENNHFKVFFNPNGKWYENWIYCDSTGISVIYRDITTEKATQLKLEENLERLNLIVDATNEAIWDWDMLNNEVWGNDKYDALLGNKKSGEDNFTAFSNRIFHEDRNQVYSKFQEAVDEKKSDLTYEYRFVLENNEMIHLFGKTKILYNSEDVPYRTLGSIQDITLQKKIQQEILQQNEISESLINSIPGLFYLINAEGKIIRSHNNQIFDTQYDQAELINANAIDFLDKDDHLLFRDKFSATLEHGMSQAEFQIITKGGKKIPILFSGVKVKYMGQDCVMGVGIDISDRVQYQKELKALTSHLEQIREEERTKISREIHDELGQQLTGLKMELSWIKRKTESTSIQEKIKDSINLVENTIKTVRRITTNLRPGILDDLGLIAALEWQMEGFQKRYNINAQFETNVTTLNVSKLVSTSIFRIFQESLTNIAKHAHATEVIATLKMNNNNLILTINDNGIGFDASSVFNGNSYGIIGMRERTTLMNGVLQIDSKAEKGTKVILTIPIHND